MQEWAKEIQERQQSVMENANKQTQDTVQFIVDNNIKFTQLGLSASFI
ncbi:hypothetical protein [Candidatus Fukatsuia symbiotica]|nr:hypothetical protein [Candidatus Fukatsuia symbiotica]